MANVMHKNEKDMLTLHIQSKDSSSVTKSLFDLSSREDSDSMPHSRHLNSNKSISVVHVSKHYKVGKQTVVALRDVSLSLRNGEFVAIVGPSGSGKSTLLQLIGLLDVPSEGKVIVNSDDTTNFSDNILSEMRQSTIGFIFQSFYLQPFLSVSDNVSLPAMFKNETRDDIALRVEHVLSLVGLSDRAKHFPKELSGGQIQRAAIARALINEPQIILADEPTGNLDSQNSESIMKLFRAISSEFGVTVVVVTHDMTIARQADRIIQLRDGAVV